MILSHIIFGVNLIIKMLKLIVELIFGVAVEIINHRIASVYSDLASARIITHCLWNYLIGVFTIYNSNFYRKPKMNVIFIFGFMCWFNNNIKKTHRTNV